MHILIVEPLLVIYLFYLGSELILIGLRKPIRSSICLVRYSWSLSICAFSAGSCPAEVYEPANRHRNAACTQQSQPHLLDLPIPPSPPGPLLLQVLSSVRETYQFTVRAVITVVDDIFPHQHRPTEALLLAVNTTLWMAND